MTLLEVLIALALSSVLLAGVYVALDLHWQYASAGRDEAERSQLARAIANRMEVDFRSIVFRPKASEESASSSSSSSSTSGSDSTGTDSTSEMEEEPSVLSESESGAYTGTGVFGNSTTLMIHVSQPSRTLSYAPLPEVQQGGGRLSDLQSVSWFVAGKGGGSLQAKVGQMGEGLTRTSGDRLATQVADAAGDLDSLAENALILAPEISSIQFAYFDGAGWRTTWDSDALGGLPRAIEVILEIQPSGNHKRSSSTPKLYRLVVPLPIAKPLPV